MPHDVLDGELRAVGFSRPADEPNAAGSVWSTIADMARWAQFLLRGGVTEDGERLLSEAAVAAWFEPAQLAAPEDFYPVVELTQPRWRSYALGWFQQDFDGRRIDFHTGSLSGLVAIIGLDRAAQRAIVVMANRDHAELRHALLWDTLDPAPAAQRRDWHREVLALYRGLRETDELRWQTLRNARLADLPPTLPAPSYAGHYHSDAWGDLEVRRDGGRWELRADSRRFALRPWHADTFLATYPDWRHGSFLTFHITPDGEVASLEFMDYRFERREAAP